MTKGFLQDTLAKESRAYGFTIAFWGSGAMLIKSNGMPGLLEALSYGGGAVLGFALLTFYVYRNAFGSVNEKGSEILALSMVHYISALVPIIGAYYLKDLPGLYAFLAAGMFTSIGYNLGMVVEEKLSERAGRLEKKIVKKL